MVAVRAALRRVADEIIGAEAYLGYARGLAEPFFDVSDVAGGSLARSSDARLQAEPERDLPALAARMQVAVTALLQVTEGRGADDEVTWNGVSMGLGAMLGLGLAEYLLHGQDIAKALSRPWTIRPDDARLVLASALPLLPLLVNPAVTRNVRATYDVRVRGGVRVGVAIEHGTMTLGEPTEAADCHVSPDPVALLLVAYGRTSQWIPILTGKLVAWGRKPWLGPRLTGYLVTP